MQRPTTEGIQLLVDSASLERREHGPIWGSVCLSTGDGAFPDAGWTDIVVGFCVCWLHALRRLATKETTTESVFFMDGPFRTDMKLTSADSVQLTLLDCHSGDMVKHRSNEQIAPLLENAISSGKSLLDAVTKQNWSHDQDVRELRAEISAALTLLSSG